MGQVDSALTFPSIRRTDLPLPCQVYLVLTLPVIRRTDLSLQCQISSIFSSTTIPSGQLAVTHLDTTCRERRS